MTTGTLETTAQIVLALSAICALIVLGDILAGHRQKMAIMNMVWPITALYFGPIGLWAYWIMGRAPEKRKPFWQSTFVATSHCGAGCTLGDTVGEWSIFLAGVTLFGSTLLTAFVVDFALAYLVGIAFQYFSIVPMRHLGFKDGVIAALKADTISLVAFELGMFGFMALNRLVFWETPPEPDTATYWMMMQAAMIVGFATSYPANWWLLRSGLKETM